MLVGWGLESMWQIRRASSFRPIPMVWVCPPHLGLSVDPSITLVETQKMELRRPPSLPLYLYLFYGYTDVLLIYFTLYLCIHFQAQWALVKKDQSKVQIYKPKFQMCLKNNGWNWAKSNYSFAFFDWRAKKINSTNKKLHIILL